MSKGIIKLAGVTACLAWTPLHAAAQSWGLSAIGVAEYDTNHGNVLLAALSASQHGSGIRPLVGLQVSHVGFDVGTSSVSVNSIRPYAGLHKGFDGGDVSSSIGYAFGHRTQDFTGPIPRGSAGGDTENGAVLNGGIEYWGTGGPLGAQLLASYNFGGNSIWSRGGVSRRVASLSNGGQLRLGGEVAYLHGSGYTVVQPGGVVQWHRSSNGVILIGGAGEKLVQNGSNSTYVKAEIVLPLR